VTVKMMDLVKIRDGIYDLHNEKVRTTRGPRKQPEGKAEEVADAKDIGKADGYLEGTLAAIKVVERAIDMVQ